MRTLAVAGAFLAVLCARPAVAETPSDGELVGAGLGMAVPTYFIGVAVHEGSHALAGKMVGAEVQEVALLPHIHNGKFYFGRVRVTGLRTKAQRQFFLIAPKITDVILMGGYAAALGTDVLPENRYGLLAFTVLATGFWVDFTRDVFAFWDYNDTVRVYNAWGLDTELKKLPARLVHAGISVASAIVIFEGYRRVFADDATGGASAAVLPLVFSTF